SDPIGIEAIRRAFPRPLSPGGVTDRAIMTRAIAHIPDVREDPEYRFHGLAQAAGYRSHLAVPMLRHGQPIGAIVVAGASPGAFSERQADLLQTFAAQAVIAIENVRLFEAEQQRTRELRAALEQQTATSEVLRVISSSPTDIQPVLDAILQTAGRLCASEYALFFKLRDGKYHVAGSNNAEATY